MRLLHLLIDQHIRKLSGAEFKVAAYLYRLLEREPAVTTDISHLAQAAGLSVRQTQSVVRSLADKGILQVDTRHRNTRCRLPAGMIAKKARTSSGRKSRKRGSHLDLSSVLLSAPPVPAAAASDIETLAHVGLPAANPAAEVDTTSQPLPLKVLAPVPTMPSGNRPQQADENITLAVSSPVDDEVLQKWKEIHQLVWFLIKRSPPAKEFDVLLQSADGNLDRLLGRLQQLAKESRSFDNFYLLCSEVRGMVLVR